MNARRTPLLLQQRFDTRDSTSLGAPNRRSAISQADWHLSLGVGHNEHLLHHRCGGRDHSRRRFSWPARIRKAASLAGWRPLQDAARAQGIELSGFGLWATLIVAKPGE
jgi:hypothetical protein